MFYIGLLWMRFAMLYENIISYIGYIKYILIFVVLITFTVAYVKQIKGDYSNRKKPKYMNFIFVSLAIVLLLDTLTSALSTDRIISNLDKLPSNVTVLINGQIVSNPEEIINTLKTIKPDVFLAHHSSPTKQLRIKVEGRYDKLIVDLGRDSDRLQEYWVLNFEVNGTSFREVGRITTPVFDKY